jgi:hypothetical protein
LRRLECSIKLRLYFEKRVLHYKQYLYECPTTLVLSDLEFDEWQVLSHTVANKMARDGISLAILLLEYC